MPVAARMDGPVDDCLAGRGWTGHGRIDTGTDVARVLASVGAAARRRLQTAALNGWSTVPATSR